MPLQNSASLSRRHFLALSAAAPLTAALATSISRAAPAPAAVPAQGAKRIPIGLELYSVRNEFTRDLKGTLRAVAKMGYDSVEFYAPYREWTMPFAKEVRTLIDDLGLRCYSTHNPIASITPGDPMTKAIELNQILGSRLIVVASAPKTPPTVEGWKKLSETLTQGAKLLAPHGLAAGFHNHGAEWAKLEGGPSAMEVLAANTPAEFVLQLDVGTTVASGVDPVQWIKSNPGRIRSVHLKDWAPGEKAQEKAYRVLFGEGASPWREIFAAAESVGGVEYYFIEQEGSRFPELETAERCLAQWRRLRA